MFETMIGTPCILFEILHPPRRSHQLAATGLSRGVLSADVRGKKWSRRGIVTSWRSILGPTGRQRRTGASDATDADGRQSLSGMRLRCASSNAGSTGARMALDGSPGINRRGGLKQKRPRGGPSLVGEDCCAGRQAHMHQNAEPAVIVPVRMPIHRVVASAKSRRGQRCMNRRRLVSSVVALAVVRRPHVSPGRPRCSGAACGRQPPRSSPTKRDTGQRVATSAGFWACQGRSSAFVGHWNVRERPGRPTTRATLRRLFATRFKHLPGMTWKNVVSRRE